MTTRSHEQTINTALGEVLQQFGRYWKVRSEHVGKIFDEGGRPDILVEKADGWPIVIEAEVDNHRQAEIEARSRLGNHLSTSPEIVNSAIALVYPTELRRHHGAALRSALLAAKFEFALFSIAADQTVLRFPEIGWLSGSASELAMLLHRSSVPGWRVEALADALEAGVVKAEGSFTAAHSHGSSLGASIASLLGQVDDGESQTRRMAMAVIVDAFVFHAALAEVGMKVPVPPSSARAVRQPGAFRVNGAFQPTQLLDEWQSVLKVNYWPIFHTAGELVRAFPPRTANTILSILWETAEALVTGGVTKSHDLTGVVFQRLIADRKFLATFYTRPAAAALLAALALPMGNPLTAAGWTDANALGRTRIGDFACGTGTLLSTAYQRMSLLHEMHGGDPKLLHPLMMERGLVGLDVLTVAVHLTAAMLAGSYPDTPFAGECLLTMPYGRYDWGVCVGSLDLLEEQTSFEVIQAAARTAGGLGTREVRDLVHRIGHREFDLVIMNPPFTRHGAHEGERTETHNPAFAAFGATEEEQNLLARHLKRVSRGGAAHGHAGLASYFVDLADAKVAPNGRVALVLPMSALSGGSWEDIRGRWRREYSSICVATIAESGSHSRSFSADTGMAECIFVGSKGRPTTPHSTAVFVILRRQPNDTLEGEQVGEAVTRLIGEGAIRTLEDGPYGGTEVVLGDSVVGQAIRCELPTSGAWQIGGISDLTLAQTAYQLSVGKLWVEGMAAAAVSSLSIVPTSEIISRIGPHHLDITGAQIKGDGLPQGPFSKSPGYSAGNAYPALWAHDSERERKLIVEPDCHLQLRQVGGRVPKGIVTRAEARWETATRSHYNTDLQFNSQSLIIAMTETPSIGGRAWPSVVLLNTEAEFAYALWCNSTLGLLSHWWMANKTQAGRGITTVTGIPLMPTLDVRTLSAHQLSAARIAFEAMKNLRFLPFDQIDEDSSRAELDRRLLVDILGLDQALCEENGPMHRLRRKLASEPQIHGNKQTKLVFADEGEVSVRR